MMTLHPVRPERQGLHIDQKRGEVLRQPVPVHVIVSSSTSHGHVPQRRSVFHPTPGRHHCTRTSTWNGSKYKADASTESRPNEYLAAIELCMAVRVSAGESAKEVERHKCKARNTRATVKCGALSISIEATHLESNVTNGTARSIPASGPPPRTAAVTARGMKTAGRVSMLSDSV